MSLKIASEAATLPKGAKNPIATTSANKEGKLPLGNSPGDQRPLTAREEGQVAENKPPVETAAPGRASLIEPNQSDVTQGEDIVVTARPLEDSPDFRVRLSALRNHAEQVYGPNERTNVLSCLYRTNGLMFPFQPQISMNQDVTYQSHDLVHTNSDILSYTRSPSATIQINGKFSVQTQREGEYAAAAIHFLRTVTKMYYGIASGDKAGVPPPVLRLNGYGNFMFNDIRCVVKSYNYSFDENAHMVGVKLGNGMQIRLPALFSIAITLGTQVTPSRMRNEFDLDAFRTGALLQKSSGWM